MTCIADALGISEKSLNMRSFFAYPFVAHFFRFEYPLLCSGDKVHEIQLKDGSASLLSSLCGGALHTPQLCCVGVHWSHWSSVKEQTTNLRILYLQMRDVAESGESPFRLRRSQGMIVSADFKPVILAAEMRFCS
jgi:hypothetical protein